MVSDPVRQLTRMLISQVMPVPDIPSGHTGHQAPPLSNTLGIMPSARQPRLQYLGSTPSQPGIRPFRLHSAGPADRGDAKYPPLGADRASLMALATSMQNGVIGSQLWVSD